MKATWQPKAKTNAKEETKARKQAAQARGSTRGTRDGKNDEIFVKQQPIIDAESMDQEFVPPGANGVMSSGKY